jgi:hypothetical protein
LSSAKPSHFEVSNPHSFRNLGSELSMGGGGSKMFAITGAFKGRATK